MSIIVSPSRMSPLCRIFLVAMSLLCALNQSTIAQNLKKLTHPTSFQFGQVELWDHNWTEVTFKQPLVFPVVFAGPTLTQQERAKEIQVTDITCDRFYIRIKKNCPFISSKLTNATISWFAVSVGEYVTDNNRSVLVDTFTSFPGITRHAVFSRIFPQTPVLLSMLQHDASNREKNIFTHRSYTTNWHFQIRQHAIGFRNGTAEFAYMAIEAGSGSMDGFKYAAYKRKMDGHNMITYEESNFTTGPLFFSTPARSYNLIGLSGFPKAKSAKVEYSFYCSYLHSTRTVEFFAIDGAHSTTITTTTTTLPSTTTTITTTTTTTHSTTTTTTPQFTTTTTTTHLTTTTNITTTSPQWNTTTTTPPHVTTTINTTSTPHSTTTTTTTTTTTHSTTSTATTPHSTTTTTATTPHLITTATATTPHLITTATTPHSTTTTTTTTTPHLTTTTSTTHSTTTIDILDDWLFSLVKPFFHEKDVSFEA